MLKNITIALRTSAVIAFVCCGIYQLSITGIAKVIMPYQSAGSLVYNQSHQLIGSTLIGQSFNDPGYFQGRISSIDYNAAGSGSPNYASSNPELINRMHASIEDWTKNNPEVSIASLPADLITNSGSGLDPDITPEAAQIQIPRVSRITGIPAEQLQNLVSQATSRPQLGIWGKPAVNVLQLNWSVQQIKSEVR